MLADISGTKKAYLKAKIEELETNTKIKTIRGLFRGISAFKKGYQPRTIIVKVEKKLWLWIPTLL
jgi:predicted nuclease of restriction endonuclease-like RecB superfamily